METEVVFNFLKLLKAQVTLVRRDKASKELLSLPDLNRILKTCYKCHRFNFANH